MSKIDVYKDDFEHPITPTPSDDEYRDLGTLIEQGISTEAQKGTAVKSVHLLLQSALSKGTMNILKKIESLSDILDRAVDQLNIRVDSGLDTWELADVIRLVDIIQTKQLQVLDLLRKVSQASKPLFSEQVLSEDERKVVRLFKSFTTEAEKAKFLALVDEQLSLKEDN